MSLSNDLDDSTSFDDDVVDAAGPSLTQRTSLRLDLQSQLEQVFCGRTADSEGAVDSVRISSDGPLEEIDASRQETSDLMQPCCNQETLAPAYDSVSLPPSTSGGSTDTIRADAPDCNDGGDREPAASFSSDDSASARHTQSLRSRRARRGRTRAEASSSRDRQASMSVLSMADDSARCLLPPFEMNVRRQRRSQKQDELPIDDGGGDYQQRFTLDAGLPSPRVACQASTLPPPDTLDRFRHLVCSSSLLALQAPPMTTSTPLQDGLAADGPPRESLAGESSLVAKGPSLLNLDSAADTTTFSASSNSATTSTAAAATLPPLVQRLHRLDIYVAFLVALTGLGQVLGRLGLEALAALAVVTCTLVGLVCGTEERKRRTPKKASKHVELPQVANVEQEDTQPESSSPEMAAIERFIDVSEQFDAAIARQIEVTSGNEPLNSLEASLRRASVALERAMSMLRGHIADERELRELEKMYGVEEPESASEPTAPQSETCLSVPAAPTLDRFTPLPLLSPRPSALARRVPRSPLGREVLLDDSPPLGECASPSRFRLRPLRLSQSSRGGSIIELSSPRPHSAIDRASRRHSSVIADGRRGSEPPTPSDMQDFINGLPADLVHALKAQSNARSSVSSVGSLPSRPTSWVESRASSSPGTSAISLRATHLGVHIQRRRLACHLLAMSDLTAASAALMPLSTAFEAIVSDLPICSPPTSFAPRFSDSALFASHLSAMTALVVSAQSYLDTIAGEPSLDRVHDRWEALRDDLSGMIKEWERGRHVLQRSTARAMPTTHQDLPDFLAHWEDADRSASTDQSLPEPASPATADVDEAHVVVDDASAHLLATSSSDYLPPPGGVESVFEAESSGVPTRIKLSREERITAARKARAEELIREPSEASKMGDMVHELKDVIGELRRRRRALVG